MTTVSPPKPWERAAAAGATGASAPTSSTSLASPTSSLSPGAPALPQRPSALASAANSNAAAYSQNGGMNSSPFGGFGSSPYSRMGGMGGYGGYGSSMYGGGMGGYGSMYGGGMGGMGGMYGGMGGGMGMPGDPNNPNSMTNSYAQSTQATFQMVEGFVGAFMGFSQMMESAYMATRSSFFAMVSVAEQFGNLRDTLGSILGIFAILRWFRTLFAKLTGRPPPADAISLSPSAFASFEGRKLPPGQEPPRLSKKPFIFFMAVAFGLPYLMSKLIRTLAASQEAAMRQQQVGPDGQPLAQLDPAKLDFCRVLYDFTPETGAAVQGVDLAVKKGDLVAVLSKSDPMGNPSEWWRCRARDGRMGYLPGVYMEAVRRPGAPVAEIKSASQSGGSQNGESVKMPEVSGKAGDIGVESFQKSQFSS